MKLIATQAQGSRKSEFFLLRDGTYEVYCSVAGRASHAFPSKSYKTYRGAMKRATKFLGA